MNAHKRSLGLNEMAIQIIKPYYCETVEGVEIWFHPVQDQFSLKTFDPVISSHSLSAVRHMVKLSVWLGIK